jgi:hypothetical protein
MARQREPGAGCAAPLSRSALRADSPAVLGLEARAGNSLRSLRSLRSDTPARSQSWGALARAGLEPCAPRRPTGAPHPAPGPRCRSGDVVRGEPRAVVFAARAGRSGRFLRRRGAQQRRAARDSAHRDLTSSRVSERSDRRERSEFRDAPGAASTAAESARRADRRSMSPGRPALVATPRHPHDGSEPLYLQALKPSA